MKYKCTFWVKEQFAKECIFLWGLSCNKLLKIHTELLWTHCIRGLWSCTDEDFEGLCWINEFHEQPKQSNVNAKMQYLHIATFDTVKCKCQNYECIISFAMLQNHISQLSKEGSCVQGWKFLHVQWRFHNHMFSCCRMVGSMAIPCSTVLKHAYARARVGSIWH